MPTLEKIIRPFQTVDIAPAALPKSAADDGVSGTIGDKTVLLTFGENGSGKSFSGSYSFFRSSYQDKKPREQIGGQRVLNVSFPAITFP